jgi:hypothetical protein
MYANTGALASGATSGPELFGSPWNSYLRVNARNGSGELAYSQSSPAGWQWSSALTDSFAADSRGPEAFVAYPSSGRQFFLYAWTAQDSRIMIGSTMTGGIEVLRTEQYSNFSPAMAAFQGNVYICWTSTQGPLAFGQVDPTQADPIINASTVNLVSNINEYARCAPSLAVLPVWKSMPDRLTLLWTGTDSDAHVNSAVCHV